MSNQNYVRLNVELTVNGVSCPISEDMFSSFLKSLEYSRFNTRYRSRSQLKTDSSEPDAYELSGEILNEIIKSRQTEDRKCVANYCYITKDVVKVLLEDEQHSVLRELVENENAFPYLTALELLNLVETHKDIEITRNIFGILTEGSKLSNDMQKHSRLMQLFLQNTDEEVRKHSVNYLVKKHLQSEKYDHTLDPELKEMVEKQLKSQRYDYDSEEEY